MSPYALTPPPTFSLTLLFFTLVPLSSRATSGPTTKTKVKPHFGIPPRVIPFLYQRPLGKSQREKPDPKRKNDPIES